MIYILDVNSSLCPGEQKGGSLVGKMALMAMQFPVVFSSSVMNVC